MKKSDINGLVAFPLILLAGLLGALAGGQVGSSVFGLPLFALLVGIAFLVQWLVIIPSYLRWTEKFFDLVGSLTFICLIVLAIIFKRNLPRGFPDLFIDKVLEPHLPVCSRSARVRPAGRNAFLYGRKGSFIDGPRRAGGPSTSSPCRSSC